MGWGDVKTAGIIGGMLGFISWPVLLVGTGAAFVLGAIVGIASILARRADRASSVPFGPFMVTGALAALFVGAPLADAYRQLLLGA
jgi:leader peptidase (prepilin peptidase)/N-methyltransferase